MQLKKKYSKSDVVSNMLLELIQNRSLTRKESIRRYEISSITFYKYISAIRNMLIEFNHYDYELTYKNGYYHLVKYP